MLKRLNKIAHRSVQLRTLALTKRASLATPMAGVASRVGRKVGVGLPVMGTMGMGLGAIGAVSKAKSVAKEKFDPAKRDLMLGTTDPG